MLHKSISYLQINIFFTNTEQIFQPCQCIGRKYQFSSKCIRKKWYGALFLTIFRFLSDICHFCHLLFALFDCVIELQFLPLDLSQYTWTYTNIFFIRYVSVRTPSVHQNFELQFGGFSFRNPIKVTFNQLLSEKNVAEQ